MGVLNNFGQQLLLYSVEKDLRGAFSTCQDMIHVRTLDHFIAIVNEDQGTHGVLGLALQEFVKSNIDASDHVCGDLFVYGDLEIVAVAFSSLVNTARCAQRCQKSCNSVPTGDSAHRKERGLADGAGPSLFIGH